MHDIIILGSGPAGLTASIYAVRAGFKTLVIAGAKWGGQLMLTTEVENFPGFPDGIQGPNLMMNMRKQAENLGVEFVNANFTKADFSKKPFVVFAGSEKYQGKSVIIATGADSIWLKVPGEDKLKGKGISACATCDGFFFKEKNIVVVGGGDSAMEEALFLAKIAKSVTIVHRRYSFRASKAMQNKVLKDAKINIIWNSELLRYNGEEKLENINLKLKVIDEELKVRKGNKDIKIVIKKLNNLAIEKEIKKYLAGKLISVNSNEVIWQLPVDGVFLAIGHKPNTIEFKGIDLDKKGYVVKKEIKDENGKLKYSFATSKEGVFTAGDVHDYRYKQAITAAGFGCMAALDAQRWFEENQQQR